MDHFFPGSYSKPFRRAPRDWWRGGGRTRSGLVTSAWWRNIGRCSTRSALRQAAPLFGVDESQRGCFSSDEVETWERRCPPRDRSRSRCQSPELVAPPQDKRCLAWHVGAMSSAVTLAVAISFSKALYIASSPSLLSSFVTDVIFVETVFPRLFEGLCKSHHSKFLKDYTTFSENKGDYVRNACCLLEDSQKSCYRCLNLTILSVTYVNDSLIRWQHVKNR